MKHEVFLPQHLPNISTWLKRCPDTNNHAHSRSLDFGKRQLTLWDLVFCCPMLCVSECSVDLPVKLPIQVWGQSSDRGCVPHWHLLPLLSLFYSLCLHRSIYVFPSTVTLTPPQPSTSPPAPVCPFFLSPYVVSSITFHFLCRLLNSSLSKNTWVAVITNVFLYVLLLIERTAVHPLKETAGLWRLRMRHTVSGS